LLISFSLFTIERILRSSLPKPNPSRHLLIHNHPKFCSLPHLILLPSHLHLLSFYLSNLYLDLRDFKHSNSCILDLFQHRLTIEKSQPYNDSPSCSLQKSQKKNEDRDAFSGDHRTRNWSNCARKFAVMFWVQLLSFSKFILDLFIVFIIFHIFFSLFFYLVCKISDDNHRKPL
jgi:hypothetical protein